MIPIIQHLISLYTEFSSPDPESSKPLFTCTLTSQEGASKEFLSSKTLLAPVTKNLTSKCVFQSLIALKSIEKVRL
jgi:hypothetical protein